MTDERIDDDLLAIVLRLPPGSGIVFRHLRTPRAERQALLRRVRRIAVARRLTLTAIDAAIDLPAHGGPRPVSAPAHTRREAIAGARAGARYLFVSPINPTRTHPGARVLGLRRAMPITRGLRGSTVALGGMSERRWRRIARHGFAGWAAIDAWLESLSSRHPGLDPGPRATRAPLD